MNKEKLLFIGKVTFAHVFTYMLCGLIAMNLFNYGDYWTLNQDTLRSLDDPVYYFTIPIQMLRGILYSIVLLLIKDSIVYSKFGVLKLYVILIILGIFNCPDILPGSIEGFLHMAPNNDLMRIKIGGKLEILTQNLLFCIIVCTNWKNVKERILKSKTK